MKTWTPDAAQHFETWLGRVRQSVASDPGVDAEDVAQDLRAHVHAELEAASDPVTRGELERVLDSLGNLTEWTDGARRADRPASAVFSRNVGDVVADWQRKLGADWGLPVALFAMTLVAIPTFNRLGAPMMVFAYILARAHVTHSPDRIEGRKRWLLYTPLAIGSGVLTGLVLGFPLTFRGIRIGYADQFETLWVLGSWWVLVGLLAAREPRRVRSALKPFADTFDASHGRMLSLIGVAFLIASSVVLLSS